MYKRVSCEEIPQGKKVYVEQRDGRRFIITEEDQSRDITEECTAELKKSGHSAGFYVLIKHGDKQICALGLDDLSKHQLLRPAYKEGYKLVKADGASVSFRVVKG